MTSTLARQVAALGVVNKDRLTGRGEKERDSYLFERKVGAQYDLETIYEIGLNGLIELEGRDDRFGQYHTTLFSQQSKRFDRTVQTAEENAKLDEIIEEFLLHLGPFLLEKSAAKAIEWLVRRYSINKLNVDALLLAFLPYLETNQFSRLLQILAIEEHPLWFFFTPAKKAREPLTRTLLVKAVSRNTRILEKIGDWVFKTDARNGEHQALYGFYGALVLKLIEYREILDEPILVKLLGLLFNGLRTSHCSEVQTIHILIASAVTVKVKLSDEASNTLLEALLNPEAGTETLSARIFAFTHVIEVQNVMTPSNTLVANLAKIEGLVSILLKAKERIGMDHFLKVLAGQAQEDGYLDFPLDQLTTVSMAIDTIEPTRRWSRKEVEDLVTFIDPFHDYIGEEIDELRLSLDQQERLPIFSAKHGTTSNPAEATTVMETTIDQLSEPTNRRIMFDILPVLLQSTIDSLVISCLVIIGHSRIYFSKKEFLSLGLDLLQKSIASGTIVQRSVSSSTWNETYVLPRPTSKDRQRTQVWLAELICDSVEKSASVGDSDQVGPVDRGVAQLWTLLANGFETRVALAMVEMVVSKLEETSLAAMISMIMSSLLDDQGRLLALETIRRILVAHREAAAPVTEIDLQLVIACTLTFCTSPQHQIRSLAMQVIKLFADVNHWGGKIYASNLLIKTSQQHRRLTSQEGTTLLSAFVASQASIEKNSNAAALLSADLLAGRTIDQKLSKSESQHVLRFFCSFVSLLPERSMQMRFLGLLRHVKSSAKAPYLASTVIQILKETKKGTAITDEFATLIFQIGDHTKLDPEDLPNNYEDVLMDFLSYERLSPETSSTLFPLIVRQLKAISSSNGDTGLLMRVSDTLIDSVVNNGISTSLARQCQGMLHLDENAWHDILQKEVDSFKTTQTPARKRQRSGEVEEQVTTVYSRTDFILECLQSNTPKMTFEICSDLLEVLDLLCRNSLQMETTQQHLVQTILTLLQRGLDSSADVLASAKQWRVDVLINALQQTNEPQSIQQIISTIGKLTEIAPEVVLRYTTPLLTYMGSSVVQRDDALTVKAISELLHAVLPIIVQSQFNSKSKLNKESSRALIDVFVAAIPHIPSHRRIRFVTEIVRASSTDWFLGSMICLLIEAAGRQTESKKPDLVLLSNDIIKSFNASEQMSAVNLMASQLSMLIRDDEGVEPCFPTIQPQLPTSSELGQASKQYQSHLFHLVDRTIRSMKVADLGEDGPSRLERIFEQLVVPALSGEIEPDQESRKAIETIARHLLRLMPSELSLERLIVELDNHERPAQDICNLLIGVLSQLRSEVAQSVAPMNRLVESLVRRLDYGLEHESETTDRLFAVCRVVITRSTKEQATSLVRLATSLVKIISVSAKYRGLAVLILQSLIPIIGPRLLPHLSVIVEQTLMMLDSGKAAERTATLGMTVQLYQTIPSFLSTYTDTLLPTLLQLSCRKPSAASNEELIYLDIVLSTIVKRTSKDEFLKALGQTWEVVKIRGKEERAHFVDVLGVFLRKVDRAFVIANSQEIFDLQRSILENVSQDLLGSTDLLEAAISSLLEMIMKLNEKLFRPLFARLHDWAYLAGGPANPGGQKERTVVFLQLMARCLEVLKDIFFPFFTVAFDETVAILGAPVKTPVDLKAWDILMRTLGLVFSEVPEGYWETRRFNMILEPLIEQTTRADILGSHRSQTVLASVIASFSASLQEQDQLRQLNHGLLMTTRSEKAAVRMSSLCSIEAIWKANGDEYLPFVAESVSFFAELLEDEDREVEGKTRDVIQSVEEHLGESLEAYLK